MAFRTSPGLLRRPLRREQTLSFALLLAALSGGCAGAKPKQVGDDDNFSNTPSSPPASADSASADSASAPSGDHEYVEQKESWSAAKAPETSGLNADQKAQMQIALRRGGEKAANCATVVVDAPSGEGSVTVVFDGKKGRCVDVNVGPPFAGTAAESCIKRAFVGEIVLPFEGQREVPYTVKLSPRTGTETTDKDAASKDASSKDGKGKGKKK